MPQISAFMICGALESFTEPDGSIRRIAVDPNFALHPPCIPSAFAFTAVIGISGLSTTEPNLVRIRVVSPEGKMIHDSGITQLPPAKNIRGSGPSGYEGAIVGYTIQNLFLDSEGVYRLECEVNGEELAPQEVPVFV